MKRPYCFICGRFAAAARDPATGQIDRHPDGTVRRWVFRCIGWDDYLGGWEHE